MEATAQQRERGSAEIRRRAILDAAAETFLERGYAEATVDAVVERAGGSKATVYAMFGSKEGLFAAAVADCAERFAASLETLPTDGSFEDGVRRVARVYVQGLLQPERLAMFRLVVGDSGRLPEVGDTFYRLGPEATVKAVGRFLRDCARRAGLEIGEPDLLASYFLGALRGGVFYRVLLNPTRKPTPREVERHIAFVVETFLHGVYETGRPGAGDGPQPA